MEDQVPDEPQTGEIPEEELIPDEPRAVDEPGTTAEEHREGESLDERLEEEEPDLAPEEREEAGVLVEEGRGLTDTEKYEVAEVAEAEEGLTAEEEAVRLEDEAPGGTDGPDSYVVEEE